jgi:hypothetical protein
MIHPHTQHGVTSQVTDDGENEWMFESKPQFTPHPGEARVFWWSLYLFTVLWGLFAFVAVLKLNFAYLVRGLLRRTAQRTPLPSPYVQ